MWLNVAEMVGLNSTPTQIIPSPRLETKPSHHRPSRLATTATMLIPKADRKKIHEVNSHPRDRATFLFRQMRWPHCPKKKDQEL
jgi:hypothetical protein